MNDHRFTCHREHTGHTCTRERGHRGQHQCWCSTPYTNAPTSPIRHHDLVIMTFPESSAA